MPRDDFVLPVVRAVAAVVVIVLILAVIVLYGMPGETERFWAWTIQPEMTPLLMGAGYAAGCYFFVRVLTTSSWRAVTVGFLPITVFTSLLLVATLLHWENFNHGHVAFFSWTFLYVVTPFLVPALWLVNRRRDPGRQPDDVLVPIPVRGVLAVVGAAIALLALAMFVEPDNVIGRWPWQLSPLTARTVSAYLALTGGTLLLIAQDGRWRAARVLVESLLIGTVLIIIGINRAWGTLDPSATVRWTYLGSMVAGLALLIALYAPLELRRASDARRPRAAGAEQSSG